ncbi:hypothetical protein LQF10_17585 [Ruania halotolerans]|nr:hypothetical protein [Ruania halotolerans]UFU06213.1 hypothetical protein LQF10_17585 [Ruania halotolerans]
MCRAVTCTSCGKTTWAGCGDHVEEVMRTVPRSQQCPGHAEDSGAEGQRGGGTFSRIVGR